MKRRSSLPDETGNSQINWHRVRRIRLIKTLLVFPGALLIPYALFWLMENIWWQIESRRFEAKLRNAGLPAAVSEWDLKLPPPEENFGALEIFAPFADIDRIDYNGSPLKIFNPDTTAGRALLIDLVDPSSEEAQQPENKAKLESVYSQLIIGKDRPHAKLPFRSGADAISFFGEPILNWSEMGDLVVWRFKLAAADKNHIAAAEAAQTLLQLLRLKCATEFLQTTEFYTFHKIELLDDLENILDSGLRNSLFSRAFLKDFAERLEKVDVLGAGKKSVATFYCLASEKVKALENKADYEAITNSRYRYFDWPFFLWEDQVVKLSIFLIPKATYQLQLLELNKFNWENTFEPLQALRPEPVPPNPKINLHNFLMTEWYNVLSGMNSTNALFVDQTRLNLLKAVCEMEAIRLGGDVSREEAFKQIQTRDYFNDGKPLRASHDPDGGVVIYSTGPNRKDDGGAPDLDITIRLPTPNRAQ